MFRMLLGDKPSFRGGKKEYGQHGQDKDKAFHTKFLQIKLRTAIKERLHPSW